jgi:anthranilate 1,2-dioxygenase small subunit
MDTPAAGPADDPALRHGIHELIAEYAECIDEDRLEAWPDLFDDPCRYLVTSRANHEAGLPQGVMYAASRGMLLDRVFSLRRANIFEPHRYRHVVGPVRLKGVQEGTAMVHAHFIAARIMHDGTTSLFATGRYLDRIDVSAAPFRFRERIVVLDSDKIDTLLAIPL